MQNMTLSCIHLIGVGCNFFKAACCHVVQNAVSGSGSIAAFWLELGVRDMFFFSDLYTHKRDKPTSSEKLLTHLNANLTPPDLKEKTWVDLLQ